jgi:hypothetical protein
MMWRAGAMLPRQMVHRTFSADQGLCVWRKVPGQDQRLGDLNPGRARTLTALAVPSQAQNQA